LNRVFNNEEPFRTVEAELMIFGRWETLFIVKSFTILRLTFCPQMSRPNFTFSLNFHQKLRNRSILSNIPQFFIFDRGSHLRRSYKTWSACTFSGRLVQNTLGVYPTMFYPNAIFSV